MPRRRCFRDAVVGRNGLHNLASLSNRRQVTHRPGLPWHEGLWAQRFIISRRVPSAVCGTGAHQMAFKLFKKGSTTQLVAAVSYDASTDTGTLNPNRDSTSGVTYKAVVTTGAKDSAGNSLDQTP